MTNKQTENKQQTVQQKSTANTKPGARLSMPAIPVLQEKGAEDQVQKFSVQKKSTVQFGTGNDAAPLPLIQSKANNTGIPDNLKSGVESLSGMDISDVKVHYNSSQPAQLNALAYAQGSDIHVAPGQEKYLPHEAWHVVQQKQGRVQATKQMKAGVAINDDSGLEHEADVMGSKALSIGGNQPVQRMGEYVPLTTDAGDFSKHEFKDDFVEISEDGNEVQPAIEQMGVESEPVPAESLGMFGRMKSGLSSIGTKIRRGVNSAASAIAEKAGTVKESVANSDIGLKARNIYSQNKEKIDFYFGNIGGPIKKSADAAKKVADSATYSKAQELLDVQKASETFGSVLKGVFGVVSALVSPLIDIITNSLGIKEKWNQWGTYKEAAVVEVDGKEAPKPGAPPEATYGLDKIKLGFFRKIKDLGMSIWSFTNNLIALIPAGITQIIAGISAASKAMVEAVGAIASFGKKTFQFFAGEKKKTNAESLLKKALDNDVPSLQLIFNLKLGSVAGSGLGFIDKATGLKHQAENMVKSKLGMDGAKGERITDFNKGAGGPADIDSLYVMLKEVCKNGDSKNIILKEIEETMTGVGT